MKLEQFLTILYHYPKNLPLMAAVPEYNSVLPINAVLIERTNQNLSVRLSADFTVCDLAVTRAATQLNMSGILTFDSLKSDEVIRLFTKIFGSISLRGTEFAELGVLLFYEGPSFHKIYRTFTSLERQNFGRHSIIAVKP